MRYWCEHEHKDKESEPECVGSDDTRAVESLIDRVRCAHRLSLSHINWFATREAGLGVVAVSEPLGRERYIFVVEFDVADTASSVAALDTDLGLVDDFADC